MKPGLDTPLSDAEFADLDRVLLESGLDAPMDISMLDGFLCAVLAGPRTMPPSAWMPWIWDYEAAEQVPQFDSPKVQKQVASLVLRFANEIALGLKHAPESFEPLFSERETEGGSVFIIDDWCFGFLKGISLDAAGWQPLRDARPELFATIDLYGTEAGWKKLEDEIEHMPDADALHAKAVAAIAPALRGIHAHWLDARKPEGYATVPEGPRRAAVQPGRNAPCPCGSGRKFKQCHGRTA